MSKNQNPEQQTDHHKDGSNGDDGHSPLHAEALEAWRVRHHHRHTYDPEASTSAFSQHGYWSTQENEYYQQGKILVLEGDSLYSIARKALLMRGASIAGPDAILDEEDRIRALNMTNPHFKYMEHSHYVCAGMILDISEPRIGPDINTAWQPWQEAPANAVTYVRHGQRAVAEPGAKVVVEPGGAAMLNPGSTAFGYQNSYIEGMPGSVIVTAGEAQVAPGAKVVALTSDTDVTKLSPDQERMPQLFPRQR
jgi:hypothetical protein